MLADFLTGDSIGKDIIQASGLLFNTIYNIWGNEARRFTQFQLRLRKVRTSSSARRFLWFFISLFAFFDVFSEHFLLLVQKAEQFAIAKTSSRRKTLSLKNSRKATAKNGSQRDGERASLENAQHKAEREREREATTPREIRSQKGDTPPLKMATVLDKMHLNGNN